MDELQLVGYTADLHNLVFSDERGATRYKAAVDEDLLSTLEEVLELREPERPPLRMVENPPTDAPNTTASIARTARAATQPPVQLVPRSVSDGPGTGGLAAFALAVPTAEDAEDDEAVAEGRTSRLSPREIQAMLRAGKSPAAVAREAGTDELWVRRWLPPIEAEREQVIAAVQRSRVEKSRLGPSRDLVGEAVRKNLAAKGIGVDDDSVEWLAARTESDLRWTVVLRYRSRGRQQRATWRFDAERGVLESRDKLATELAWTRGRRAPATGAAKRSTPSRAKKKTAKRSAKKSTKKVAKRSAKKSAKKTVKKTARKRPAQKATKRPVKKATKKGAAKRATAKRTAPKRTGAKKATPAAKAATKGPVKKAVFKKAVRPPAP